ncbi:MAG: AAA family ATPase [Liquorilactobacillus ghanensis]|jgi:nucleoside-triphosphatase THEP1|uniref:AAA family ATPase n=1 Tax=Liquorilactobacillus ghanensis TaxID=399370 RepID=UPI0039E93DCD
MEVVKAKREQIKVPIMLTGASGSGKTVSALLIAKGIVEKMFPELEEDKQWEKVGVIDTEHKRSLLYADTTIAGNDIGEFLVIDLEPPFTVQHYKEAVDSLKKAGCEIVVIDSITHEWSGEGGVLEQVQQLQKGNPRMQMMAWNKVKPLEKEFARLTTMNSVYTICTCRSKQAYDMDKIDGKTKVTKLGLKPDQKDNLEYEFAISLMMNEDHTATATKDNSNMFDQPFEVTKETGKKIYEWSAEGINIQKEKEKLIKEVLDLSNQSEKHKKMFDKMNEKINISLEDAPIRWIKRMKEVLSEIEPELEEASKG